MRSQGAPRDLDVCEREIKGYKFVYVGSLWYEFIAYKEERPLKREQDLNWKVREWIRRERYISGCLLDFESYGWEGVVRGAQQD